MPERGGMQMGEAPTPSPRGMPDAGNRRPLGEGERDALLGRRMVWLFGWGTKGGLAVLDQGLFAGAQFVLNILLARWLAPAEYGAFAVAYSVFLLAAAVHSALLIEPMIVYGSGKHFENRRSYLGVVLRGHGLLTVVAGLTMFGVAFLLRGLYSESAEHALFALGLILPVLLLAWLTRRAFYIELRPGRSAAGSAIYFCALLSLVWWLHIAREITPTKAILTMGAAALLTGGLQLAWLRPQWRRSPRGSTPRDIAREHWNYGRWILASAFPSWVLLNIYYLALPAWFGLKAAGVLKALANLAMPAGHSLTTLGMLTIPLLVRHRKEGGLAKMRRTVRSIGGLFFAGAVLYLVALWVFRIQIIHFLYGGRYLEYSNLPVFLIGLIPLATAGGVTFGAALRACERPDRIFWGYLAGGVVAVSAGLWLAASWGVVGALVGTLAAYASLGGAFWLFYRRLGAESATT